MDRWADRERAPLRCPWRSCARPGDGGGRRHTVASAALFLTTESTTKRRGICETTERAEVVLPMATAAPRAARALARASGCTDHAARVLDDALLLVSELVTHAVLHGKAPLALALECGESGLRVRARDAERMLPRPRRALDDDVSGRGLTLVDRIGHAWGVESVVDQHGSGKAIWFELRPSG